MLLSEYQDKLITIAAPIANQKKGEFVIELTKLFEAGFYRFQIDGQSYKFKSVDDIKNLKLKKTYMHTIDLLIDALDVKQSESSRLQEAVERALMHGFCEHVRKM
jgi:excinuclease ABC subunit A